MSFQPTIAGVTIALNGFFAVVGVWLVFGVYRRPSIGGALQAIATLGATALAVTTFLVLRVDHFYAFRILSYAIFGHGVLFVVVLSVILWRRSRWISLAGILTAMAVVAVGADAFWIEPEWLETTNYVIDSKKVRRPVRAVVIADLQTNSVGDYERRALEAAKALRPDLILFAGDYLQEYDPTKRKPLQEALARLLLDVKLTAPLGVFAVRGNTDWDGWERGFQEAGIRTIEATEAIDLGDLVLTGLSVRDSFSTDCRDVGLDVPSERFHLVVGHSPDYSLSGWTADLLVCGHTHGGQVRIPGIGPIITSSQVPRAWACGLHEIRPRTHLFVSRGVGRERALAPSMRFYCRPELAVLELTPSP